MSLPIDTSVKPMLAKLERGIPEGDGWLFEPKWDGFRALVFREVAATQIRSRNALPLERYFPELLPVLEEAFAKPCVVDGEIVIEGEGGLDFGGLQMRIHPAASRVKMLAEQTPATFIAFDMLALGKRDLRKVRFAERRRLLQEELRPSESCFLTPQTSDPDEAAHWFERFEGAGLDGIIAKKADLLYLSDERAMVKVKHERTVDVVVGGYRGDEKSGIKSLLLGLYDDNGGFHFVGFTSTFNASTRKTLHEQLQEYRGAGSFGEGRIPGEPSRWSGRKDSSWISLKPDLVIEVAFDHMEGDRFRHGTRFLRWRPDKDPKDCTYGQITPPAPFALEQIRALSD